MRNNNGITSVGLIRGRHEMPVSNYIFEEIEKVHDYKAINARIMDFLTTEVGLGTTFGSGVNQNDYTDVEVWRGNKKLVVYVTGLTCVTAELIRCCALNGVQLSLMNYDVSSGTYIEQPIF